MSVRASRRPRAARTPTTKTLASLFEAVPGGIYIGIVGAHPGVTIAANPHLKLIFGYPPECGVGEVRPLELDRFVDPLARQAFLERLARDGAVADYLLRLRRADNVPVWIEITAHAAPADQDGSWQIQALLRDVSERRKLEDQGRDLYHQLLQAEKLAALGQTVSGVAHELNNPLATILTWAERLAAKPLDAVTKRGIDTILSESERAARIVRTLLTFSRKHHTTRSMVDLNQVVRETLALRAYDQRVSNILTIEALAVGLPQVFADPHQVKQVLLNLVINAEQAMLSANGRGTLVVRTWYDAERDSVVLEINDDGPGVPEDVRSKIFDPFFTTKAVGKGTGLGLTVAYAIVEEHGGRIRVESSPGRGASFYVELPASDIAARPAAVSVSTQPAENIGAGAPVLVVEDEPALASAVAEALTDAGFRVDRAADGEEALARVRDGLYDLVICDLKMPRLDGPAFYRAVSDVAPALTRRVVFVTGDVAGTDAERFLLESGCRWLAKPFRLRDLLRVARDVVT